MATSALDHRPRPAAESALVDWLTTVDHKKIGILYGGSAFIFFLIGGLEALIIRAQLTGPQGKLVSPEFYNQLFTMHGTTMIFLAVMPLSAMFFNFFIPLQIGARDVAFPRLNACRSGYSCWAACSSMPAFLWGAPNGGWFGYAPLSGRQYSPGAEHGLLGDRPADPGHRLAGRRRELLHHHRQHARPRHEAHPHADVRLDELHHPAAGAALVPGHHRRADHA